VLRCEKLPEKANAEHDWQHHGRDAGREDRCHRRQPKAPALERCADERGQQGHDTARSEQRQHAAQECGSKRARVDERVHETSASRRRTPPSEIRP
jgi:hypothetical protein